MTPAEQLGRLPEPIQEQLWALVREVAGFSQEERHEALAGLEQVGAVFVALPSPARVLLLQMFAPLGDVIAEIYRAAEPRTEGD